MCVLASGAPQPVCLVELSEEGKALAQEKKQALELHFIEILKHVNQEVKHHENSTVYLSLQLIGPQRTTY